jgi:hypothetical protein
MTCKGENYDVDNVVNSNDCCEVLDDNASTPNHLQSTALYLGSFPCTDSSSTVDFYGHLPADRRDHNNPMVDALSPGTGNGSGTGAAPDWFVVYASGGVCVNDYAVSLTMSGGGNSNACYNVTIYTNNQPSGNSCSGDVTGQGSCSFSSGSGSYSDGTDVYFKVEKTCSVATEQANAAYHVHFHL